jgi:hypothetical protein
VVSLADLSDLQVELVIKEEDLPRVRMDQPCDIQLDSLPGVTVRCVVDEIAPQADRQKATVHVKVKIVDPSVVIRPEVNARVNFLADRAGSPESLQAGASAGEPESEPGPWAPRKAVARTDGSATVFIVTEGAVVARPVRLGRETAQAVEILEGLIGTEEVVVDPPAGLTSGDRVKVAATLPWEQSRRRPQRITTKPSTKGNPHESTQRTGRSSPAAQQDLQARRRGRRRAG